MQGINQKNEKGPTNENKESNDEDDHKEVRKLMDLKKDEPSEERIECKESS
jgi:hypothetical protein